MIKSAGTAALVWRNDKNQIIPGIAESVPTLDNGEARFVGEGPDRHLEVTYKMRKNVKWHDGTPVTSADVKFEWETIMNPDYPVIDRTLEKKVASIDTPDDYTVIVKYMSQKQAREAAEKGWMGLPKDEYEAFAGQEGPVTDPLYNRVAAVMPKHAYSRMPVKDLPKSEFARKPMGMGAYRLKDWVAGQSITLEANPDYFLGAPKIKTVVYKIVPDTNTILAQLEAGQVDYVSGDCFQPTAAPDLDRIAAKGVMKPYYVPAMKWEHLDMNLDHEFLKDIRVRKAIAHSIDRKAIVDRVLGGKVPLLHSWIMPDTPYYEPGVTRYEYNRDLARQLLAEAGFKAGPDGIMAKDGKPLRLLLQTTAGNKARELTTQVIQQHLKEIGIAVDLDYLPAKNLFAAEGKGPITGRTFQMVLFAFTTGDDPGGMESYHSSNIPSERNQYSGQNISGWRNAKADELLVKATSSLSEKERKAAYSELQKLFAEDLPSLPMYQYPIITVAKASLKNFKPTPTLTPPTWNIHEWELER